MTLIQNHLLLHEVCCQAGLHVSSDPENMFEENQLKHPLDQPSMRPVNFLGRPLEEKRRAHTHIFIRIIYIYIPV